MGLIELTMIEWIDKLVYRSIIDAVRDVLLIECRSIPANVLNYVWETTQLKIANATYDFDVNVNNEINECINARSNWINHSSV